jgi:hypothetical protein
MKSIHKNSFPQFQMRFFDLAKCTINLKNWPKNEHGDYMLNCNSGSAEEKRITSIRGKIILIENKLDKIKSQSILQPMTKEQICHEWDNIFKNTIYLIQIITANYYIDKLRKYCADDDQDIKNFLDNIENNETPWKVFTNGEIIKKFKETNFHMTVTETYPSTVGKYFAALIPPQGRN